MQTYHLAGVDLAWISDKNPTAIAYGSLRDCELTIDGVAENLYGAKSVIDSLAAINDLHGIAIDAPLIINNPTGQRPCERLLSSAYGARKAACHASNLNKYPDADSVQISVHLETLGFNHLVAQGKHWQLECYPHPAIIEVFGLKERHLYKKGTVKDKRQGQSRLSEMLISLEQSNTLQLCIPEKFHDYFDPESIASLRGKQLKHNEDVLDAVVCLYIAGLYQIGNRDKVFGDTTDGYIYVPQKICV